MSQSDSSSISLLVTGASSQIGRFLLPLLAQRGFSVHALSRTPRVGNAANVFWHQANIEAGEIPSIEVDCLIHLAPLPLLAPLLPVLCAKTGGGVRRIIAFGSTSRFTKQSSNDQQERDFAKALAESEQAIACYCESSGIPWTVFRPTLIYGCGMDKNITVIAKFIRRFGFFPFIGDGEGLRMPVHAEDLAAACLAVLENSAAYNRAYDLSGGEILSYRTMVERIFAAEGMSPRFIPIPLSVLKGLMSLASLLPRYRYLSAQMAERMKEDLCFDHEEASRDFGYAPRKFTPSRL